MQPANIAEKSTKLSGHKEKIQAVTQELRKSINLHTNRRKRKVSPGSDSAKPLEIQRQNYAGLAHCSFNCVCSLKSKIVLLFFKEHNFKAFVLFWLYLTNTNREICCSQLKNTIYDRF